MKTIYVYPDSSWVVEESDLTGFSKSELETLEEAFVLIRTRVEKSARVGGGIRIDQTVSLNGKSVRLVGRGSKPSILDRLLIFIGLKS